MQNYLSSTLCPGKVVTDAQQIKKKKKVQHLEPKNSGRWQSVCKPLPTGSQTGKQPQQEEHKLKNVGTHASYHMP